MKIKNRTTLGFTLIEILVTVSIISFLASILATITSASRARASDAATSAQGRQFQLAFQTAVSDTQSMPHPGDSSTYYCLGKTSAQTCTFWGLSLTGNDTVNTLTNQFIKSSGLAPTVTIDGQQYNGLVYKCGPGSTVSTCNAAMYWAQSAQTPCQSGIEVLVGDGGRICGINATGDGTNYVELGSGSGGGGEEEFDFSISATSFTLPPQFHSNGQTTAIITLTSGTAEAVTVSTVSTVPPGMTISYTNNPCTPSGGSCNVTVNVGTPGCTPETTYPIQIKGVSASGVEKTTTFNVTVNYPGPSC